MSIVDEYRKALYHFKDLAKQNVTISTDFERPEFGKLLKSMASIAKQNGLEIYSCAEKLDLAPYGITAGKCIDEQYIKTAFGLELDLKKDKNQRAKCGCIQSKDIGAYDTCLHGCRYCYAGSLKSGLKNKEQHLLDSPSCP